MTLVEALGIGEPIITPGSRLLPVLMGDVPAMLKVAMDAEETFGNLLMTWWVTKAQPKCSLTKVTGC